MGLSMQGPLPLITSNSMPSAGSGVRMSENMMTPSGWKARQGCRAGQGGRAGIGWAQGPALIHSWRWATRAAAREQWHVCRALQTGPSAGGAGQAWQTCKDSSMAMEAVSERSLKGMRSLYSRKAAM